MGIGPIETIPSKGFGGDRLDMRLAALRVLRTVAGSGGPDARMSGTHDIRVAASSAATLARFPIDDAIMRNRSASNDSFGTP